MATRGFNIGFNFQVNDTTEIAPTYFSSILRFLSRKNTLYTSGNYRIHVSLPVGVKVFDSNSSEVFLTNGAFYFDVDKFSSQDINYRVEWDSTNEEISVKTNVEDLSEDSVKADNLFEYIAAGNLDDFTERDPSVRITDTPEQTLTLSKGSTVGLVWSGTGQTVTRTALLNVKSSIRVEQSITSQWKLKYSGVGSNQGESTLKDIQNGVNLNLTWSTRPSVTTGTFVASLTAPTNVEINTSDSKNDDIPNYTVTSVYDQINTPLNSQDSIEVLVMNNASHKLELLIRQQSLNSSVYYGIPSANIIKNDRVLRTYTATTDDTLVTFATGSDQTEAQKRYVIQIYNSSNVDKEKVFSVSYGNINGSGSVVQNTVYPLQGDSEARAIYSQHARVLENLSESVQRLSDGVNPIESAYFIDFNNEQLKLGLDPGVWQLTLDHLSGSSVPQNSHTGSNIKKRPGDYTIELIDNSILLDGDGEYDSNSSFDVNKLDNYQHSYAIISGSITDGPYRDVSGSIHRYGRFYPSPGTLVLNGETLDLSGSFNTVLSDSIYGENAQKLYTSLNSITMRTFDTEKQEIYIIPVKYKTLNFSTNPSYVTDYAARFSSSNAPYDETAMQILNKDWIVDYGNVKKIDAKTYPTTIGLYDSNYNLMAIGKISQPQQKSQLEELLFHVRLRF